jgi:hypothetical protein
MDTAHNQWPRQIHRAKDKTLQKQMKPKNGGTRNWEIRSNRIVIVLS